MRTPTTGEAASFGSMRRALVGARHAGHQRWGADFVDLGRSEPLGAWPEDHQVDVDLRAGKQTRLYSPVAGWPEVRTAVADHYAKVLGVPLGPHNIFVSSGALTGLTLALATLCRPGDDVGIASPHYHALPSIVELVGGRPRRHQTAADGRLAAETLPRGQLDVMMLVNPNNPTGATYDRPALEAILGQLGSHTAVVADEVYAEYLYEPEAFTSLAAILPMDGGPEWLVVRSAAKTLGRPGLRVGVVIGSPELVEAVTDRAAALTGAASTPAQLAFAAGLAAARGVDHIRPYRSRLELALATCRRVGLTAFRPRGTYYLWVDGPGLGSVATAVRLCVDAGVFAWPGQYFGSPSHVRVSLAASRVAIETGLCRIAQSVAADGGVTP